MKGPKALISSAIAEALAQYFVIDESLIETNLLKDTKIALHDVTLRPQTSVVTPKNTFGKSTHVNITGSTEEVIFSWSWSVTGSGKSWVKDAALTIKGAKFKVEVTQEDPIAKHQQKEMDKQKEQSMEESLSKLNEQADQDTAKDIEKEGSMKSYLMKQVEMIIDALTLQLLDFEMEVQIPSPTFQHGESFDEQEEEDYLISLIIGGENFQLTSRGRYYDEEDESMLGEELALHGLYMNILEKYNMGDPDNNQRIETYPLQDPFSYAMDITRTNGKRFGSTTRGLIVKGGIELDGIQERALAFHLARPQMEAFGQFSGLFLAPPSEAEEVEKRHSVVKNMIEDVDEKKFGKVSVLDMGIDSCVMNVWNDTIALVGCSVHFLADGTDLSAKADLFTCSTCTTGDPTIKDTIVRVSAISSTIRPDIHINLGTIETLNLPDLFQLEKPMENVTIDLFGETWEVNIDSVYGSLPAPPADEIVENAQKKNLSSKKSQSSIKSSDTTSTSGVWVAPFPFCCKTKLLSITKEEDEDTKMDLKNVELLVSPEKDRSGTKVAVSLGHLESKLANGKKLDAYAVVPAEINSNTFRDFAFAADNISVAAGYKIQDWIKQFAPGGRWSFNPKSNSGRSTYYKLPHAQVSPLKMKITYNAMNVVAVKDVAFRVNAFKGKENTTSADLAKFYVKECLSHSSGFLQNAEVLGLNVEQAGTFGLATTLGWATPAAPFIGLAAIVGVDSVKGAIEAGKRQRHADKLDKATASDFFRGIGYSAVEATEKGKLRRGSIDGRGNALDWVVGTTENTGEYLNQNKDKIGGAGGATAGVVIGTLVAGPVGAIVGGIFGGASTGYAIKTIDKRSSEARREERREKA